MKTIFASSPHCSVFRCQAFTAIDLLLKNKYVTGENDCHVFYLKFIKKNASLFSWSEDFFSPFLVCYSKKIFSWVSVMQKLSRCVWVLIRCGKPIFTVLLLTGNKRKFGIQARWRTTNKYKSSEINQCVVAWNHFAFTPPPHPHPPVL